MSILSQFTFKGRQEQAVNTDHPAIVVTAGAGSGKTRVLAGRFLYLLEQGHPLGSLIAITFTEKAAREMRTRIRSELERWAAACAAESTLAEPAPLWVVPTLENLDAARIGTIHSLCAELLRAHPAEAGIDPAFNVLEEGLAALLRAQAIEAGLVWAAADVAGAQLFTIFKENELRRMLEKLISRRLDLQGWLEAGEAQWGVIPSRNAGFTNDPLTVWSDALAVWLRERINGPAWQATLADLADLKANDPDDKLEVARRSVLAQWDAVIYNLNEAEWDAVFEALARLRKVINTTAGSKTNWDSSDLERVRDAMRTLSRSYDVQIKPLISKSCWALDKQVASLLPTLRSLIQQVFDNYAQYKDKQQSLDFDDLEVLAARLLTEHSGVRDRWQASTHAVLVDEFQDTNDRQRQIVYALSHFSPSDAFTRSETMPAPRESVGGGIFIVGDAKQSIYKFRGADVTVFRQVQDDIAMAGGLAVNLDLTFRAHKPLLELLNPLLAAILGEEDSLSIAHSPYQVPFAALQADRLTPQKAQPPYIEFHLGSGKDAEESRVAATSALAQRLHRLGAEEGFQWSDIALLFRASSAFEEYEDALEHAGIPFVTIAGRGFYNRPEIRDLMNVLTAIADPTDDLALAGALRSPALALPDYDLYHLRFPNGETREGEHLWFALQNSPDPIHQHVAAILSELHALSGRSPAAEVLKRLLDLTGIRAVLSTAPSGGRMLRNVEKLLADAHRSQLVGLGDFLEYIQTLRNVGLREGEAPVEAGGVVQLMTIHKSKGLEFPVVAICDANYEPRPLIAGAFLDPSLGLLPPLKDADDLRPVAWTLARLEENAKDEAEEQRLLYVAATRAKEKLLVSGNARLGKSGKLALRGWLADLGRVLGMDEVEIDEPVLVAQELREAASPKPADTISWVLYPPLPIGEAIALPFRLPQAEDVIPGDLVAPLVEPVAQQLDERTHARESDPPERVWRVVPKAKRPSGPAWVVGQLFHEALRRWRFPTQADALDYSWEAFIVPYALETGLVGETEIHATLQEVRRLLERFQNHPLFTEIESAERYHELPYVLASAGNLDYQRGVIDLLYRTSATNQWVIVDFKTDEVKSEAEARQLIQQAGYDQQMQRYVEAIVAWLGCLPQKKLVFLRVAGEVMVFDSN